MRQVAILDLRMNDAWAHDWILVDHSYVFSEYTQHIAYGDSKGHYVFFDGSDEEARAYFSNYCEKHGLELVDYSVLEEKELRLEREARR